MKGGKYQCIPSAWHIEETKYVFVCIEIYRNYPTQNYSKLS